MVESRPETNDWTLWPKFSGGWFVLFCVFPFLWLLGFCCSCCLFCFNLVLFLHSNKLVKKKKKGKNNTK